MNCISRIVRGLISTLLIFAFSVCQIAAAGMFSLQERGPEVSIHPNTFHKNSEKVSQPGFWQMVSENEEDSLNERFHVHVEPGYSPHTHEYFYFYILKEPSFQARIHHYLNSKVHSTQPVYLTNQVFRI